ncbi:TPA: hypothetical protein ACKP8D_000030 [Pseudomonas putida]
MNTIVEIIQYIVKNSEFKDSHIAISNNKLLLNNVSGEAGIDTVRKVEIATLAVILTNEIRLQALQDEDFEFPSYTRINTSKDSHTTTIVRFLNLYDKEGKAFEPMLEKLKNRSGEKLTALILPELQLIHTEWLSIYKNADKYLNLELNYVAPDEVAALRRMVESGIFYNLMNDTFGYARYFFQPLSWKTNLENILYARKTGLVMKLLTSYEHCLDFKIKLPQRESGDDLWFISKDDEYYIFGMTEKTNLIFYQLTNEYDLFGYPIDLSCLDGSTDNSENIRQLIEMSQDETSLIHKTRSMAPKEAMKHCIDVLGAFLNTDLRGSGNNTSHEFHREFLMEMGLGEKYAWNSMIDYSDEARQFILNFVSRLEDCDLEEQNLPKLFERIEVSQQYELN